MYLPMQCQPVQRRLAGQPCASQTSSSANGANADSSGQGIRPSEYGVQPSGANVGNIITGILQGLSSFF